MFVESSTKSSLTSSLTRDDELQKLSTIKCYNRLIDLKVPSIWQTVSNQRAFDTNTICIELWVFWFDDQTFNLIEKQSYLKELKGKSNKSSIYMFNLQTVETTESKSSSFSWSQWCAGGLLPTESPKRKKLTSLKPGKEYGLFIKSIRTLVQNTMLKNRKALVLGDFFIFPDTAENQQLDMMSSSHLDSATMLAYTYNIYLTSANLVFQPNARRIRIRPLSLKDLHTRNLKGQYTF